MNASSAAVHLGVLVANGVQLDHYNLSVHFLAVDNFFDCGLVDGEHSVLDAFLQKHLLFIGVTRILGRVQREVLIGPSDRDC